MLDNFMGLYEHSRNVVENTCLVGGERG